MRFFLSISLLFLIIPNVHAIADQSVSCGATEKTVPFNETVSAKAGAVGTFSEAEARCKQNLQGVASGRKLPPEKDLEDFCEDNKPDPACTFISATGTVDDSTFSSSSAGTPQGRKWATCEATVDGECKFNCPQPCGNADTCSLIQGAKHVLTASCEELSGALGLQSEITSSAVQ